MAKAPYKLSCVLVGHMADVRAVATLQDGTIISTSRDKTARVWKPTGTSARYSEGSILKGHTNFVSSVCALNPSKKYPRGYIITGSNDSNICVYAADNLELIRTTKAHENTVCNLRSSKEEGMFLSSSWDCTAKLWSVDDGVVVRANYVGHTAAVWCVADLEIGRVITGSADKMVIVWLRNGSPLHRLTGHTDCVRDLATIKNDEFISCANDGMIRCWNALEGVCLATYHAHENYIYSIAATANGTYVVTAGEEFVVKLWHNGELQQTISVPAQSIWCVDMLPNRDIVTGSSDGVVLIFSGNPESYADEETLKSYEERVANAMCASNEASGGARPQPEVATTSDAKFLERPGKKDGEVWMVRDGSDVKLYRWSQRKNKWEHVQEVSQLMGDSNPAAKSGKPVYNGVEYDYVFSVDIQDGVPPLKLPYNKDQDPWEVAQKFLHDNELSQLFLEEVANFVIKNSQPEPSLNMTSQAVDPLTGSSRYIPRSAISNTSVEAPSTNSTNSVKQTYVPHTSYLRLEQANLAVIHEKLREFNGTRENASLSNDELESAMKLTSANVDSRSVDALRRLLDWPREIVFPALDVARLAVLHRDVQEVLCDEELLRVVQRHLGDDALPSNQMLAFRLLANMFCHAKGEKLGLAHCNDVVKALLDLKSLGSKNNQVAVSTYILNLTVALTRHRDEPGKRRLLDAILALMTRFVEPEALFRVLVALGTILAATSEPSDRDLLVSAVRHSEIVLSTLRKLCDDSQTKLSNCSKQIVDLIL